MKLIKKFIVLLLTFTIVVSCFVGCASKGKTLMSLNGSELSVNTFQLLLSRQKGILCSAYGYGAEALTDSFWDTIMDTSGTTYNDYYTKVVLENAKIYLAALELFNEKGLKLPASYSDSISEEIDALIEQDADGSKATFNSIIADYGVNYNMLKDAYLLEAKIDYLQDELFGADGSKIAPNLLEEYFQKTYARFKQVFFYTYNIVYESDENGDSIYYKEDGKIAYDVTKSQKTDENGKVVKDKNGDVIFLEEDGRIAYDKKNGTRKTVTDASGNVVVEEYSAQKINQIKERAEEIMNSVSAGDYVKFDALVEENSMDPGMKKYAGGYYITATTNYDSPEVVKALFEMEVGEVRMVQSSYGFHVVMKYELEKKPYEDKANADFFINPETGEYTFMEDLISKIFADYLETYAQKIVVDEEIYKTVSIKSVGANFYY